MILKCSSTMAAARSVSVYPLLYPKFIKPVKLTVIMCGTLHIDNIKQFIDSILNCRSKIAFITSRYAELCKNP